MPLKFKGVRTHKFNAQPTVIDGIRFASKAEATRYGELKMLEKSGAIADLKLQPVFWLHAHCLGEQITLGKYVADFQYRDNIQNRFVHEDVKGVKTPLYRWKKKHVEAQYGITVTEITR